MKVACGAVCVVLMAGCATRGSVRAIPEADGSEMLYTATVREAARAARDAVDATHMPIVEADWRGSGTWYLIAWTPGGEYLRVLCEDVGNGVTAVRILARERGFVPDGVRDWSATLFALVALELESAVRPAIHRW